MPTRRIAIVGGGIAGLYAAWRLRQMGCNDMVLIEARDEPGGRVASFSFPASADGARGFDATSRFDLGPTWYWPALQGRLDALVGGLGLATFPQGEDGDMVFERSAEATPLRTAGCASSPPSMRLKGGMGALVDALRQGAPPGAIVTGRAVTRLQCCEGDVVVEAQDAQYPAQRVLLAVPPRLAITRIDFSPALPADLIRQWAGTSTWMAPHAKYLAVYDAPFWREDGYSGEARSMGGPLGEIHDASLPGGGAALFGFFAIPAQIRRTVAGDAMRAHCRTQLARLFGPRAAAPRVDVIKDWALERYTTTASDLGGILEHPFAPAAAAASGPWAGRLVGIGSEWSQQFPGYVAGAIEAADRGLRVVAGLQDRMPGRVT